MSAQQQNVVLEVAGVHWASEKAVAEAVLGRRPGVLRVEANPVGQTAVVTYDPAQTSVAQLSGWVRDCGYHCAGQSVPQHVCDPRPSPTTAPRRRPSITRRPWERRMPRRSAESRRASTPE
jgi:P-type Cu2+ transporter